MRPDVPFVDALGRSLYATSSDLASLGHLPLEGKAFFAWGAPAQKCKKPPHLHGRWGGFDTNTGSYLAALAALIASIIIGTTLNRSPSMP